MFPVGVLIMSSLMVGLDWPLLFVRNVETPVGYLDLAGAAQRCSVCLPGHLSPP